MTSDYDRIRETFLHFPVYLASEEEPNSLTAQIGDAQYLMMPVGSRLGSAAHDLALLLFTSRELCQAFLKANSDLGAFSPVEFKSAKILGAWMRRHPFRGPTFGIVAVNPPTDLSVPQNQEVYEATAVLLVLDTLPDQ